MTTLFFIDDKGAQYTLSRVNVNTKLSTILNMLYRKYPNLEISWFRGNDHIWDLKKTFEEERQRYGCPNLVWLNLVRVGTIPRDEESGQLITKGTFFSGLCSEGSEASAF